MKKINKNFINLIAYKNFKLHLSLSRPLIQVAVKTGLLLINVFGQKLQKIPLLKIFFRSTSSLISMHNVAAQNGLKLENIKLKNEICLTKESENKIFDLIIIGSGPGGAMTANNAMLIKLNFLIIEKGNVLNKNVQSHSVEQMSKYFKNGGQELMLSWPLITFAQGENWGGGSSINSGLYHEIPTNVRQVWENMTGISKEALELAKDKVISEIKVEKQGVEFLGIYENSPILKMKKDLDWNGGIIPRWRKYLNSNQYIHYGMEETYLNKIKDENKLLEHDVISMKLSGDVVVLKVKGYKCEHQIKTRKVCMSAGTIGTPEILVRSKIAKPKDFYFQFHAMVKEIGKFKDNVNNCKDIDPHQIWNNELDLKIGAAVGTPELLTMVLENKGVQGESDFSKLGSMYISLPSIGRSGLLKIGKNLYPYFFPSKNMRKELKNAQRILRKAIHDAGGKVLGDDNLSISTVHIFGSIPLGKSKIIDTNGYLLNSEKKIFIRDASLLPSHPMVNPQGPLMQLLIALDDSMEKINQL